MKDFINFHSGGGVFDIDASHKCNISLISSSFRNGRNPRSRYGGVVSVRSPILTTITIQNSTIQHISIKNNMGYGWSQGAAIYITFVKSVYSDDIVSLNILNSSFLDNLSQNGGAIAVIGRVSLTVINSIFMRNKARDQGGSFYFKLNSNSTVNLQNVSFVENSAGKYGRSIYFSPSFDMVSIVATFKDVNFTRNDAGAAGGAIGVRLWPNLEITFKKVRFVENTAPYSGSAIALTSEAI